MEGGCLHCLTGGEDGGVWAVLGVGDVEEEDSAVPGEQGAQFAGGGGGGAFAAQGDVGKAAHFGGPEVCVGGGDGEEFGAAWAHGAAHEAQGDAGVAHADFRGVCAGRLGEGGGGGLLVELSPAQGEEVLFHGVAHATCGGEGGVARVGKHGREGAREGGGEMDGKLEHLRFTIYDLRFGENARLRAELRSDSGGGGENIRGC